MVLGIMGILQVIAGGDNGFAVYYHHLGMAVRPGSAIIGYLQIPANFGVAHLRNAAGPQVLHQCPDLIVKRGEQSKRGWIIQ